MNLKLHNLTYTTYTEKTTDPIWKCGDGEGDRRHPGGLSISVSPQRVLPLRQHPIPQIARIASAVLGRQGQTWGGQASDREQGRGAGVRPAGRGWSCRACDSAGASRAGQDAPAPRGAGGGVTAGGPVLVRAGAGLRPPGVRAAAPGAGAGSVACARRPITRFMGPSPRPAPTRSGS